MKTISSSLFFLVLFFTVCRHSSAQVPDGSYRVSCTDISFDSSRPAILHAKCGTGDGQPPHVPDTIDTAACDLSKGIWNDYGYLRCIAKPGTWGLANVLPNGSYLKSCRNLAVTGLLLPGGDTRYTMTGVCSPGGGQDMDHKAIIRLSDCDINSDVSNNHGDLQCKPK